MAINLSDSDELRRHMAQIRRELHEDVQGVVRGAEAATDWRRYVRNYPWAATGLAFAVGFLIVPRRRSEPAAPAVPYLAGEAPRSAPPEPSRPAPEKPKRKPLWRTALGLATPFLLRSAQGYALQYFEQFLAQRMAQQGGPFSNLAAQFLGGAPEPNTAAPGPVPGPGFGPMPGTTPRYPS